MIPLLTINTSQFIGVYNITKLNLFTAFTLLIKSCVFRTINALVQKWMKIFTVDHLCKIMRLTFSSRSEKFFFAFNATCYYWDKFCERIQKFYWSIFFTIWNGILFCAIYLRMRSIHFNTQNVTFFTLLTFERSLVIFTIRDNSWTN